MEKLLLGFSEKFLHGKTSISLFFSKTNPHASLGCSSKENDFIFYLIFSKNNINYPPLEIFLAAGNPPKGNSPAGISQPPLLILIDPP